MYHNFIYWMGNLIWAKIARQFTASETANWILRVTFSAQAAFDMIRPESGAVCVTTPAT
jgi:hypothetical protein